MIRIVHTACAALLVTVTLIAYGVKEETRALRRQIEALADERQAVRDEIATLEAEWDHINSPATLRRIAMRLYGDGMLRTPEGDPLAPWTAAQLVDLDTPVAPDAFPTSEIQRPVPSGDGSPQAGAAQ